MKLTNMLRDTFVEKVMNSIPAPIKWDDDDIEEKIRIEIEKEIPAAILKFVKDNPRLICRTARISLAPIYDSRRCWYVNVLDYPYAQIVDWSKYTQLLAEYEAQQEKRNLLERRLRSVAYNATTVEKLSEMLPELTDFMPIENVKFLPAETVNLANDLLEAGLKI